MTIFESIKSKSTDEFAEWLGKFCDCYSAPWWQHYDENYCKQCNTIVSDNNEYAYCELNGNCRFFKEMDNIPDIKQTIKIWLESECN